MRRHPRAETSDKIVIQRLVHSRIYQDYARAFRTATKLPVELRSVRAWAKAHCTHRKFPNPYCAVLAGADHHCEACARIESQVGDRMTRKSYTVACFAGLSSTSVPIMVGQHLLGFLQTGQAFSREPSESRFNKAATKIINWGINTDLRRLEEAYFHASVISSRQYRAMIRLLEIFASHLELIANRLVLQGSVKEPPLVRRAKAYIEKHSGEKLALSNVSRALNVSANYFCRIFKRMSGITFGEYLNRVRIERAKTVLLNKHLRVKEVAFKVGFQSVNNFNRAFRAVAGQSPTEYRRSVRLA